jgi:hypothetical protein
VLHAPDKPVQIPQHAPGLIGEYTALFGSQLVASHGWKSGTP